MYLYIAYLLVNVKQYMYVDKSVARYVYSGYTPTVNLLFVIFTVYFDVDNVNNTVKINMNLGKKTTFRLWEVRIVQVHFSERAPAGCLQYHTGIKGVVQTMNFADNGRHLADQEYTICMRQEEGMCTIGYT